MSAERDALDEDTDAIDAPAGSPGADAPSNGELLKRLLRFQFKLALDGLRDVILSPIAIGAVILGIVREGRSDEPFEAVLRFGRHSDVWIDLFENHADDPPAADDAPVANASALFGAVESALREEYEKGASSTRGADGDTPESGDSGAADRERSAPQ